MDYFLLPVIFVTIFSVYWLLKLMIVVFFDGGHWIAKKLKWPFKRARS